MKYLSIICVIIALVGCNQQADKKHQESENKTVENRIPGAYEGPFGEVSITINIAHASADSLWGETSVAGNTRSFSGSYSSRQDTIFIKAKEPGDMKEDGSFEMKIFGDSLTGIWTPNIEGTHGGPKKFNTKRK